VDNDDGADADDVDGVADVVVDGVLRVPNHLVYV
jgi:hypothetical protein